MGQKQRELHYEYKDNNRYWWTVDARVIGVDTDERGDEWRTIDIDVSRDGRIIWASCFVDQLPLEAEINLSEVLAEFQNWFNHVILGMSEWYYREQPGNKSGQQEEIMCRACLEKQDVRKKDVAQEILVAAIREIAQDYLDDDVSIQTLEELTDQILSYHGCQDGDVQSVIQGIVKGSISDEIMDILDSLSL